MQKKKYIVCRKTDGLFFYRASIPCDLQELLKNKKEFRICLHTQDQINAQHKADKIHSVVQGIYAQIRMGFFMTDSVSFLKKRIIESTGYLLDQGASPFVPNISPILFSQQPVSRPTLGEVYSKFKSEMEQVQGWSVKTQIEYDGCLSTAIEILGDIPIDQIKLPDARRYKDMLLRMPPNRNKDPRFRGLPAEEAVQKNVGSGLSNSTINKHLKCIGAMFNWANKNICSLDNVFSGLKVPRRSKPSLDRSYFTDMELKTIFDPDSFSNATQNRLFRFWIPILALFTGARLNELCQLHVSDVREEHGTWVIDINDHSEYPDHPKQLKNIGSERLVPLHNQLIELGFLEYWKFKKSKERTRLFEELNWNKAEGYGRKVGRWFNDQYLRKTLGISDSRKTFHSFRHTVGNQLKQKGVAESFISELLGHSSKSITMGRYGKSYQPRVLLEEAVMRLEFGVDYEGLKVPVDR